MTTKEKPEGIVLPDQMGPEEVSFLDILRTQGELCVPMPRDDPKAARAILDRIAAEIHGTEFEIPMRPLLDNIRFDMIAAELGAFPPGSA